MAYRQPPGDVVGEQEENTQRVKVLNEFLPRDAEVAKAVVQAPGRVFRLYAVGFKLIYNDPWTPEEKLQMAKDTLLGSLLDDDKRTSDVFAKAIAGAVEFKVRASCQHQGGERC